MLSMLLLYQSITSSGTCSNDERLTDIDTLNILPQYIASCEALLRYVYVWSS